VKLRGGKTIPMPKGEVGHTKKASSKPTKEASHDPQ
jgi:hypothetical protein